MTETYAFAPEAANREELHQAVADAAHAYWGDGSNWKITHLEVHPILAPTYADPNRIIGYRAKVETQGRPHFTEDELRAALGLEEDDR